MQSQENAAGAPTPLPRPGTAVPVLETRGLGKRFGRRWAVRDLSLSIFPGEVFGFLGPNGAGKSTTIRMILSLVRPTTGEVLLFGKPLRTHRREVLARVGGLVERADFYLYLTARKNLEIVGSLRGGVSRRAIDEVLDVVGLLGRADDKVKTYSHGMKQRLGIAQALLGSPELIVLDEPTSGLDPQGIKEVRELIGRLRSERAMTVFLSSHLLHEIEQTATSMAIINGGSVVAQGPVRGLLDTPVVRLHLEASPAEQAERVLRSEPRVAELHRDGAHLECTVPVELIPRLNGRLVDAGVAVHSLVPRRSLEEYFLSITEGASEIVSSGRSRPHQSGTGR
jgi:ABC-type multidrug transport system ATPase subunit